MLDGHFAAPNAPADAQLSCPLTTRGIGAGKLDEKGECEKGGGVPTPLPPGPPAPFRRSSFCATKLSSCGSVELRACALVLVPAPAPSPQLLRLLVLSALTLGSITSPCRLPLLTGPSMRQSTTRVDAANAATASTAACAALAAAADGMVDAKSSDLALGCG